MDYLKLDFYLKKKPLSKLNAQNFNLCVYIGKIIFICVYLRCTWADKLIHFNMLLRSKNITFILLNQQEKNQRPRSICIPIKHTNRSGGFVPPNYINNLVGLYTTIHPNRIIVKLLCYLRFLGSEMKRCALDRKHALLENCMVFVLFRFA